jgi:hypothetical protein
VKRKLSLFGALLVLNAALVFGQTAAEVEAKYGKPTKAYSVSEFIWMTPEYADDGQVCRMRLYPKRVSGDTNYVVKDLPFDDFRSVVDQLIPVEKRGAKNEPFDGAWTTGGGSMWATFNYERVRITYSAGFLVKYDPESLKRGEYVFSLPQGKPDNEIKADDDFLLFHKSRVEIVTITWRARKCSSRGAV